MMKQGQPSAPPEGFVAPPPSIPPPQAPPPTYAQAVGMGLHAGPQTGVYNAIHPENKGPTIITSVVPLGNQSTHIVCPHCYHSIQTETKTEPGLIAYLSGALLCLLGCVCGCCLVPCCIPECMDVHHKCPNCNAYLGRFRRV